MNAAGWRRWLFGVWAVVEVLLFGGLVYGWPSLVLLLKPRHIFSDGCPSDVTGQLRHGHSDVNGSHVYVSNSSQLPATDAAFALHPGYSVDAAFLRTSLRPYYTITARKKDGFLPVLESVTANGSSDSVLNKGGNFSTTDRKSKRENCPEQDEALAFAYTIITAVQSVGSIAVGHAQRSFGMRKTRIVTGLTYISGLLMVGFVTQAHSVLVIIGMICVAVSGLALLITNIGLGVMFGKGQTTFVGILSGCYDVSAIMQQAITSIVRSGADYLYTYIGVAVLSCLTLVSTLLWLPKGPIVVLDKQVKDQDIIINDEEASKQPLREESQKHTSYVTSQKLLKSLTSPLFLLHVLWFSFLQLRLFFFVGVMNRWLTALTDGDANEVAHFTSVQLYSGISSVVFALLAGSLYDIQRHRYKDASTREKTFLGGAVVPMLLGSALCCSLSALVLISNTAVLYLTFLVLAAFRSFMYSLAAAFIAITFPVELFGVLYGTMVIAAGVVGCLQFPLFIWSEHSHLSIFHVNIFLLCTSAMTFLHPLHLIWKCWRSQPPLSSPSPVSRSPAESPLGQMEENGSSPGQGYQQ